MNNISVISAKAILLNKFGVNTRKAALFVLILLMLPVLAAAQYNVPDANFRTVLSSDYGITFDGANNISNPIVAANITALNVSLKSIADLTGIAAFSALTTLDCYSNQLTSLDVSGNTALRYLNCAGNQLTSLDVSANTALVYLSCYTNQLTSLDVSANTALSTLSCHTNQLTSLDVSGNTALSYLYCMGNQLTSLDMSGNTALINLNCSGNQLTSLDVSAKTALTQLWCQNNQLTSLDVSANTALNFLYCSSNQLTSLDVSANTALVTLYCDRNRIPIILTDGSITPNTKDPITQVAILRDSTPSPVIAAGDTGAYVLGASGAIVNITANNGPQSTISSSTGTNPGVVGSLPPSINIQTDKFWTIENSDLMGVYNLILDLTPFAVNINSDSVIALIRTDDTSPWKNAATMAGVTVQYLEPFVLINGLASFSDFAISIFLDNVPDANFRAVLSSDYGITFDGANNISNPGVAANITSLDVSLNSIADLTGIAAFSALKELLCQNNQLTSLDVSANTALNFLYCSSNQLTSLDVSGNTALRYLGCGVNQLTSLDVSANTALLYLNCGVNQLTSLDVSANTALTTLYCDRNQLTSLDVSANTALSTLSCYTNQLTSLDVSANTALTELWCQNNQLTSLDVSANTALETLYCDRNRIPIILTDGSITPNTKDPITQVAILRDSTPSPVIAAGDTGAYVLGASGAIVNITANNGPQSTISSSTGTNPGVVGSLPPGMDILDDKYWTMNNADLMGVYNLILDLTPFTVNMNFDSLTVLKRADSADPWQVAATIGGVTVQYLEPFVLINGLASFSDFAIGTPPRTINVPDSNFRAVLSSNYGITFDGANNISNPFVAANITSLDVSLNSIADLTGIAAFSALTELLCQNNQLTSLDVSGNTALRYLGCGVNQLTSLDVSANTALLYLNCGSNQLTSLDVSKNTALTFLECISNQLTSLDVSANSALNYLNCDRNQLTSLDVSANTALTTLWCQNNQLTSLDVSANTALTELWCQNNQLTSLDVSGNTALRYLGCGVNQLTSLDVSANTALVKLYCHSNQLTSLDVSGNTALQYLSCFDNPIPIILKDGHDIAISKDALTQVAILRESTPDPVVAAGDTGAYVLGSSGAIVNITANNGPQSTISSSTGTNPGVVDSLPPGIDILRNKYWTINNADLTGVYNLILDLTPFAVNMNFENLAVLKRADSADPWQDAATIGGVTVQYLAPFVLINGLTSFSDFAIASGDLAPLSFDLLLPVNEDTLMDLSAAVEFVWQPAVDLNDDSVTYSLRIYGAIDLDTTINVSADTAYTFNGSGLLEHGSEYHWQVFATDGAYTTSSSDTFRFFTPQNMVNRVEDLNGTPKAFSLEQNYPNPFNPSTKINFNLPKAEHVKIDVYNIRGQKVQQLLDNTMSAGRHQVEFNAQNISSGVYVYKIEAGSFQQVKKMILLR